MMRHSFHHGENKNRHGTQRRTTREKEMENGGERMLEQVENDSQTGERNWANLLERIRYNKSSEEQTY